MTLDPVNGGGTAERTIQVTRELLKLGVDARILTTDAGLAQEYRKSLGDIPLVALPCVSARFYLPRFSFLEIKKMVAEADVVNLMCHWTLINALVYFAARSLGKPYTVCPAGALPLYGRSKFIKQVYNLAVGRRIIANAAGHIAISTNEFGHFKNYSVPAAKISLIPNGVNQEDFIVGGNENFRKKHSLGNAPIVLFVGRLNFIKGPDLLLRAFAAITSKFPDHQLVFVGPDGGMLQELRKISGETGISGKVHFLGYLKGQDKTMAYCAADLLVIPSRQEAMSIVVLEAGVCGIPVLLTDQCGFDAVSVANGGMVVPASAEGIGKGLELLLNDKNKLKLMGQILRKYVQDNFTWRIAAEKYLRLSRAVLAIPAQGEALQPAKSQPASPNPIN